VAKTSLRAFLCATGSYSFVVCASGRTRGCGRQLLVLGPFPLPTCQGYRSSASRITGAPPPITAPHPSQLHHRPLSRHHQPKNMSLLGKKYPAMIGMSHRSARYSALTRKSANKASSSPPNVAILRLWYVANSHIVAYGIGE